MEIKDLAGLSQPLKKLIECVRAGMGKVYEPIHTVRMAKARAKEIAIISEAINSNISLPVKYDKGEISIDSANIEELIKRTGNRLLFQEMQKQQNIESVIANAAVTLENETQVSDEPVDKDWILRFFNSIEDISTEEMQNIWGSILAGEIKRPHSFSLRTLETVKNLSKQEAELFQAYSQFVIQYERSGFIHRSNDILFPKHGIKFSDLLRLEECGLLKTDQLKLNLLVSKNSKLIFYTNSLIGLTGTNEEEERLNINAYLLTSPGIELYRILKPTTNEAYFVDFMGYLRDRNSKLIFAVHQIISTTNEQIEYDDTNNILPPKPEGASSVVRLEF